MRPSLRLLAALVATTSIAAAGLWAWVLLAQIATAPALAALALWLLCAGLVGHFWRNLPQGQLRWDGQQWFLEAQVCVTSSGPLHIALDLQHSLWLQLIPSQGRAYWLWLEQRHAPAHWHSLRCAVYSRPAPHPLPQHHDSHPFCGSACGR